jgi:hypothetical protein
MSQGSPLITRLRRWWHRHEMRILPFLLVVAGLTVVAAALLETPGT